MSTQFWKLVTEIDYYIYRELETNISVMFLAVYQYVVGLLNTVLLLLLVAKLEIFEKCTPLHHDHITVTGITAISSSQNLSFGMKSKFFFFKYFVI
jgi:hypothetical protein